MEKNPNIHEGKENLKEKWTIQQQKLEASILHVQ